MTVLFQINALAQKWHLAYFVQIDGHFDQWLEIQFNLISKFTAHNYYQ